MRFRIEMRVMLTRLSAAWQSGLCDPNIRPVILSLYSVIFKHKKSMIRKPQPNEIDQVRHLFIEYQQWLGIDLCFQQFEAELASLPGAYAEPTGAIFVVDDEHGNFIGCIAIRPVSHEIAELKRLYVKPAHQGNGHGKRLLQQALAMAKATHYNKVVLDTLPRMETAKNLYRAFGFIESTASQTMPLNGLEYFEKTID